MANMRAPAAISRIPNWRRARPARTRPNWPCWNRFARNCQPEVFTSIYKPPVTDGSGENRKNLREAQRLFAEAGWQVKDGVLTHTASGEKMQVEFLLDQPNFERIVSPYARSLERLGIKPLIRMIDTAQYKNRTDTYDFDIVIGGVANSLSPGNEQREYWSAAAADRPGSRNLAGVKSPVVDALIDRIIFAENRAALVAASRALDRVLLWGHYLVPQWHTPVTRTAYWNVLEYPSPCPIIISAFLICGGTKTQSPIDRGAQCEFYLD